MRERQPLADAFLLFVFLLGLSRGVTGRIVTGSSWALKAVVIIFLTTLLSHLSKYACTNAGSIIVVIECDE
ncbi:hypothetical protein SAMN05216311_101919 [Chitinophaga sp. CF418]|nr:hypothetical protein SAMN05216311_101919 [Chitinophaga sp. CF418]